MAVRIRPQVPKSVYTRLAKQPKIENCQREREYQREYFQRLKQDPARYGRKKKQNSGYVKRTRPPRRLTAYELMSPDERQQYDREREEEIRATTLRRARLPENVIKHRECTRNWWLRNRERHNDGILRRRALSKRAPGHHTAQQWMDRVAYYGWRCAYCGKMLTKQSLTQDHWKPLSKGGSQWAANLLPACRFCNTSLHNRRHPAPSVYVLPRPTPGQPLTIIGQP